MNRDQVTDKHRIVDPGQKQNLQQRPSFVSRYRGNTRYYSGIDAEIFVGDKFIEEIYNIEYSIVQEHMPIFGYNSYLYDEMAVGSRIVTGAFVINFTETNFLGKVLDSMQRRKIIAGADRKLTEYNHNEYDTDSTMDPSISESKHPIWDQQFEILVAYGEKRKKFDWQKDHIEIIEGVQLTNRNTRFDAVGNPIQEVYSFTARNIRYSPTNSPSNKPGANTRPLEDKEPKSIVSVKSATYDIMKRLENEGINYSPEGIIGKGKITHSLSDKYTVVEATATPKYNQKSYKSTFVSSGVTEYDINKMIKLDITDLTSSEEYKARDVIPVDISYKIKSSDGKKILYEETSIEMKFTKEK